MRKMKESGVEWIGEIPCEWDLVQLGSLFKIRNEKVNDTDYAPLSVTRGGIVPQMENVAKSDANDNRKMVLKNDFVINSRSDRKQSCGVSELNGSVSLINTVLYLAEKVPVLPTYLNYLLKNYGFAEEFYRWGHGIVADLWTTRWQEMKSILLPIPSLETQKEILEYLPVATKKTDSLIGNVERQIEKLKAYKQSLITEVVTKGLDKKAKMKDSGVDWIGMVPVHWVVKKFGYCASVKANLVHPSDYLDYQQISPDCIEKNSCKLLETQTVRNAGVISDNHLFHKGQIIYSKVRPLLNKVIIAPFDGLCCADMYPIETENDTLFIVYMMLSQTFTGQVALVTQDRVKMPKINQEELAALMVAIPPMKEQQQIASYLDSKCSQIDRLIEIKQQKIEKLNQYKKSLIYEYVTGKREVA